MAVKIRLARIGRTKSPVYRIVAMNEQDKRNGATLEVLGTYDPIKGNLVTFHSERIGFWVARGAKETNAVKKLVKQHARAQKAHAATTT